MRLRLSSQKQTQRCEGSCNGLDQSGLHGVVGASGPPTAPSETAQAIEAARTRGILAVEMEAAALYTFARSAGARMLCLATMSQTIWARPVTISKRRSGRHSASLAALAAIVTAVQGSP